MSNDEMNTWSKDKLFENFQKFLNEKNIQPTEKNISSFPDLISQTEEIEEHPNNNKEEEEVKKLPMNYDDIPIHSNQMNENKPVTNIEDIAIKPKNIDFNKLVEMEMMKGNYEGGNEEVKPKFEYKPRAKYTDKYKISEPTTTKKYKYYSDNFKSKKKKSNDDVSESNTFNDIELGKVQTNNFMNNNKSNSSTNTKKGGKRVAPSVSTNKMEKFVPKEKRVTKVQRNTSKTNFVKKEEPVVKHENVKHSPVRQNSYQVKDNNMDNIWSDYVNKNTPVTNSYNSISNKVSNSFMSKNKEINQINSDYLENLSFEEIEALAENPTNYKDIQKRNNKKEEHLIEQIPPEDLYPQEDKDIYIEDQFLQKETISKLNPQPIQQKTTLINQIGNQKRIVEKTKIINKNIPSQLKNILKCNSDNNDEYNQEETKGNDLISMKLQELNKQIENVKKENEKVTQLKKEYEMLNNRLKSEIEEYTQKKEMEKAEFEKYKAAEMKKIEKERKAQLRVNKNIQNIQTKKEREEIESLKEQIAKLQEEMKSKDQRNKLAMDRVKKQLDEMNKKNEALQNEIKQYEELRINNLLHPTSSNTTQKQPSVLKGNKSSKSLSYKSNINSNNTSNIENINNINQMKTSNDRIPSSIATKRMNSGSIKVQQQHRNIVSQDTPPRQEIRVNVKSNFQNKIKVDAKSEMEPEEDIEDDNTTPMNNLSVNNLQNNSEHSLSHHTSDYQEENNNHYINPPLIIKNNRSEMEKFDMVFSPQYHNNNIELKVVKQEITQDGKIIKLYNNNKKEVFFPSGLRKEIFPDGYLVSYFNNNDIKQVYPDGKEVYLFSENKTVLTKLPNGLVVYKFANGQLEKNFPDGTKIVNYPDGTVRNLYSDGNEEIFFNDGSLQKKEKNGVITIQYPDGIKDTIYPNGQTKREYPDGTVDVNDNNES